ncbi:MAG: sugar kinase [Anaerolineae bacterium]
MIYDVITLGETMLRLSPPEPLRIEQASQYEMQVGGSESNVAVGLARLGLRVAWLSRLTDNALGHTIENAIRAYGVDTSHIVWTSEDRVGLYFYEPGSAPRSGKVLYDRAGSAASRIQPTDLPAPLLAPDRARLLHLSGITLAIGESAARTTHEFARAAKTNGWILSFDINYRKLLWSADAARAGCHELAAMADILFLPLRDAVTLYGSANEPETAVNLLHERYPQATIVMTLGANGAIARQGDTLRTQPAYPTETVVGRVGGGDAFVSGYLYGHLTGCSLEETLRWATASAAYKYSMVGDMPLLDREPIRQLIQNQSTQGLVR